MKDTIVEIQVFYEIAMAIGTSLDLDKMLKTSLFAYLKTLICSSGAVLRLVRDGKGNWRYQWTYAIPRNIRENKIVSAVMAEVPGAMDPDALDRFEKILPKTGRVLNKYFFHLMPLPGFGLLILIKTNKPLESHILKSLALVNAKLAGACTACLQSGEIRRMNRRLSREVRRREEAETVKQRFLANMSHELITPMNGIVAAGRLLEETALSPEQARLAGVQKRSADYLTNLLSKLLDFSVAGTESFDGGKAVFHLGDMVSGLVSGFEAAVREKGLELKTEMADGLPMMVVGDERGLSLVLEEVLSNAVKFTEKGEVAVRIRHEPDRSSDVFLSITVADTGIGIAERDQAHLFDSFFQADDPDQKRYGGTGLGLARAHHYLKKMGGSVSVESRSGRGTAFKITLALGCHDGRDGGIEAAPSEPLSFDAARILVVDDNPVNLMLLASLCKKMGGIVETAADGKAAVEKLGKKPFDLVFMDCQMPEMDGYEATATIRAGKFGIKNPNIPVIAVTAYISRENQERCRDAGMNGFIPKPVTKRKIRAAAFPYLKEQIIPFGS